MSVHYKFKSARSYDTIAFDGLHISVRDLKKAILHQKQIGKSTDFDLQITNAHSNEAYTDDSALIPKNSSLIVSRIPLTAQQKKAWEKSDAAQLHLINLNKSDSPEHSVNNKYAKSADLTSIDASEEDKIQAAIHQSTYDYDPSNYVRIKNSNQVGEVPPNYRCYKCMQPGHWIKDCKLNNNQDASVEIRKSTGIPRSFMVPVEGPEVPGAMMTPSGHFAVPTIDHEARRELPKKSNDAFIMEKPPIPSDIVCGVCKDLLTDAVMIPCCGNAFCDDCIRNVLLESEDHQCPDCKEKDVSPDTLIPSRFLRNSVTNFKNQTGYNRAAPQMGGVQQMQQTTVQHVSKPPPPVVPLSMVTQQPPVVLPTLSKATSLVHTTPPPPLSSVPLHHRSTAPPGLPVVQPETIEVLDGDDDVRPGSPAAQTAGAPPVQPPTTFSTYRGRGRGDGGYGVDQWSSGKGRGYHGHPSSAPGTAPILPLGSHPPHQPIHPPPHLHFSQSGGYVFQPVYSAGSRVDSSGDDRGYYRGASRPLGSGTYPNNGDALDYFKNFIKEKDSRIRDRGRSRSRSRSRSWTRSPRRSPGRSRSPKGRSRSPKARSRSPKGRSRSPVRSSVSVKRSSPSKRLTPKRTSPPKGKVVAHPRSRSPHKRSASRSRSRSPGIKRRSRSRSRSNSYSYSRSRSRSSEMRRPVVSRREHKKSNYSRSPPPGTAPPRSPPSRYGEWKHKSDSRGHKQHSVRSNVYKTQEYGTSHDYSRYGDHYDRDYGPSSRGYGRSYDSMHWDPKLAGNWEHVRDRELDLRRLEGSEPYIGERDRRERDVSANRIIKDIHERDKERDRIHEKEILPLMHSELRSPDSTRERSPEREKKSKKDKKKKKEESERKKKKKRPREKEEKRVEEQEEPEPADSTVKTEELPKQVEAKPESEEVKPDKPQKVTVSNEEEKVKEELFKAEDLYKDLDANVDLKPFESLKEEKTEKPESPVKKAAENASNKDVMLAPVPELSKWEKDEDILLNQNDSRPLELDVSDELDLAEDESEQVTSEVLKRAENAIFKKGVNPIKEPVVKTTEKKEKKEREDKKERDDKKDRDEKKETEDKKMREDRRERDEKREEREKKREMEKRDRLGNKDSIVLESYVRDYQTKDIKPVKSVAVPIKMDMDDMSRRRKADRIVFPEKENKTRISAKERLGAKIDDKSIVKREVKYGKVPKSDQEVVARVLHRDREHHGLREQRKVVSLSGKDDSKKDHKKKGSLEGFPFEISDEDRREPKENRLIESSASMSKKRSSSVEMTSPMKKKSRSSPKEDESSEDVSTDESVESPKKHKKKKKSKKRKKNKKKSKSKHESSSDSGSSSTGTDSESDDEGKKKRKHKRKSHKKSKKRKKAKK